MEARIKGKKKNEPSRLHVLLIFVVCLWVCACFAVVVPGSLVLVLATGVKINK